MNVIQALILGIVQGLTEFIPVSSSGHLLLVQKAMGVTTSGFTFDVALQLVKGIFVKSEESPLAWLLIAATIPAAIIGYLFEGAAESRFRSAVLVCINLAVFGLIMLLAEKFAMRYKHKVEIKDISNRQALAMGLAQAAAIVPGVSRSGSTITAGLFLGMDRVSATRFSFLLGIPITAGAIFKVLLKHSALAEISKQQSIFIIGVVTAFITGLFAIKFMLNYLAKHSLAVFAYYRIALAAVVLAILLIK
jgi:undecaprenyl-diphosphatase